MGHNAVMRPPRATASMTVVDPRHHRTALDAGVRVDTTLRELYPELPRAAWQAVP